MGRKVDRTYVDCHCERPKGAWQSIEACLKWIAASCLRTPRNDGKRLAFTLAEVLITLTIIGVIAALTVPNLMQSYKKHQVEVKLKSAYSILDNAIKMGVAENGDASDALNAHLSDTNTFKNYVTGEWTDTYIIPYLKIAKKSTKGDSSTYIYPASLRTLQRPEPLNSDIYSAGGAYWRELLLDNGMYFGIAATNGYLRVVIWVDIDGPKKGPNRVAYDVFAFSYYPRSGSCQSQQYCNFGGKLNAGEASYEGQITWGTPSCSGHGTNCAQVIQRNGWKIPDDYPVKKF